ncbi:hypothetical protein WJ16_00020 [Burkholderia metallica]|nr:hypothetical protein WJ16_00020 [Burkholderia metallica]
MHRQLFSNGIPVRQFRERPRIVKTPDRQIGIVANQFKKLIDDLWIIILQLGDDIIDFSSRYIRQSQLRIRTSQSNRDLPED